LAEENERELWKWWRWRGEFLGTIHNVVLTTASSPQPNFRREDPPEVQRVHFGDTTNTQPESSAEKSQTSARMTSGLQDFDVAEVEISMLNLLLAAEDVENMMTDHPPGFYSG